MPMVQNANGYDEEMKRCESFLLSMTPQERQHPNLLTSSYRRARITQGSGRSISDFNKFIKRFQMMKKFAQKLKKADARKLKGMLDSFAGNSSFLANQDLFKK